MTTVVFVLSFLIAAVTAQSFEEFPRNVVKTLNVTNGVTVGDWQREEFCPYGSYAAGFQLKVL